MVAAALREWDRQHGWLHSPEERAADRREAEQELARVVAALRVWHAAATDKAVAAAEAEAEAEAAAAREAEAEAAAATEAEAAAATEAEAATATEAEAAAAIVAEAAKEVAVRQATAAGRAAAEVDWRNRKGLGDDYDEETAKWRERVSGIMDKQNHFDWKTMTGGGRLTAEEEAVKRGFTRGHVEVTAAKEEEAAAEWRVTKRAAAEKAGSNMGRYDEILGRSMALDWAGFGRKDRKVMEEWEEIERLHDEAMKDGEEHFLV